MNKPQFYVSGKRPMGTITHNEATVFFYPGNTHASAVKLLRMHVETARSGNHHTPFIQLPHPDSSLITVRYHSLCRKWTEDKYVNVIAAFLHCH